MPPLIGPVLVTPWEFANIMELVNLDDFYSCAPFSRRYALPTNHPVIELALQNNQEPGSPRNRGVIRLTGGRISDLGMGGLVHSRP